MELIIAIVENVFSLLTENTCFYVKMVQKIFFHSLIVFMRITILSKEREEKEREERKRLGCCSHQTKNFYKEECKPHLWNDDVSESKIERYL